MRSLIKESIQERYVMKYLDEQEIYEDVLQFNRMYYRDKYGELCFEYGFKRKLLTCDESLEYKLRALFAPDNLARIIAKWFKEKFQKDVSQFYYEDLRWDDE